MWCFGYLFFKLRFLRLSVLFDKTDICIINVKINYIANRHTVKVQSLMKLLHIKKFFA